ncbi:MAG: acyl--CoA ligase [Rhodospirillales bacterium]|nr:acyl--CoA ligase [Rhodospirillales bacterium]
MVLSLLNLLPESTIHTLPSGEVWGAGDLQGAISSRHEALTNLGVGPGSKVIITYGGTPSFFADLFAIWIQGGCAICLNPALTPSEISNIVAFTKPDILISKPDYSLPALPKTLHRLSPPEQPSNIGTLQAVSKMNTSKEDPALILFTSGTTGQPKGVTLSFAALEARLALNQNYIPRDNLKRSLCVLPTHFGHGLIGNCLTPLAAGGDLYLMTEDVIKNAARLGDVISEHEITFMSSTPAYWQIALRSSPPKGSSLKQINIGSAPVSASLLRDVANWAGIEDVRVMYGITETANWTAGMSIMDAPAEDGLVGPMLGGNAAVLNSDGLMTESGDGEIIVQTPSLMSGYFNRPDLTEQIIKDGWFHTGDFGRVNKNGTIKITGRLKEEINRGGIKVSPAEIDMLLQRHDDITEACAFAVPDTIAGELVGVAIILEHDAKADVEALKKWCRSQIHHECVPEYWYIVSIIPKTERGKINRQQVKNMCLEKLHNG